jgi:hypothetical protein
VAGAVGVIANDTSRYSLFMICLSSLRKPVNTAPVWALTSDRILGRNNCVKQMMEMGAEWLLFLDDDHVFGPALLERLLAHKKPVVGSLYLQRTTPFAPIAYTHKDEDGIYHNVRLTEHGPDELIEVAAVGTGGMLIRAEILHAMEEPWFEHGRASEDLIFCDKVYELGLGPIYCDLGARMGHMSPTALWPSHGDDGWEVGFALSDGFSLTVPIEKETAATA